MYRFFLTFLYSIGIWSFSFTAYAENSQMLSVTPPLFQISVLPGNIWQSTIKVVNGNTYPLTVYAEVVNFQATGEQGQGKFTPILDGEHDKTTLADWININKGPYVIPPEQTGDVPFFVEVPTNAPPGGHYAAILVTTESPKDDKDSFAVLTSQAITSLMFMRVEGDVREIGNIRDFRTTHTFLQKPDVEFSLRFENKGNVHLQPRGSIRITNMWGTERGIIPVNYQTHFGNVLPESIRNFSFTWQSDFLLSDIGRYKAVATLAYGEEGSQSATATTYFWVIPLKGTLITLLVLALIIAIITYIVKSYIRRMLLLAGVDVDAQKRAPEKPSVSVVEVRHSRTKLAKVTAPLRSGVLDLRQRLSTVEESEGVFRTVVKFVMQYKVFFISVLLLVGIFIVGALYVGKVTNDDRGYRVIIDENGTKTVLDKNKKL